MILVDQPTQDLLPEDAGHRRRLRRCRWCPWLRRMKRKAAVRTVLVVVADVAVEHSSEMCFVHMRSRSVHSDPPFSPSAQGWRPRSARARAPHDVRPLALPYSVEAWAKLPAAVTQEVLDHDAGVSQLRAHVAGAAGDPVPGGVPGDAGQGHPRVVMDEEEHVGTASSWSIATAVCEALWGSTPIITAMPVPFFNGEVGRGGHV